VLPPGRFVFAVSVSKDAETATARVAITVVAGSVPTVSVAPPAAAKQSTSTALRLVGSATLDSASTSERFRGELELAWRCDGESSAACGVSREYGSPPPPPPHTHTLALA
jgi:hypothetical protein